MVTSARTNRSRTIRRSVEPSKIGSSDSWTCAGGRVTLLVVVLRSTLGSSGGRYTPRRRVSPTRTVVPSRIGPPAPSATLFGRKGVGRGARRPPPVHDPEIPPAMTEPRTIVDTIWDEHVVIQDPGAPAVLAVDLHL